MTGDRIQLRGVQPGELARLLIVVGFAAYLSRPISQLMRQGPGDQADRRWIPAGFVTASCVVSGSFFLFIVQKDLSPVLALVVTLSLMMWQAYGRPWRYVAVPLGLLLVLV